MTTRIQDRVLRVIHSNPGVEDDDKQLLAAVWREEGWNDNLTLIDNLKRVSNPESITRARRKLHELGLIEYSDEADARREKEMLRHIDDNSNLEQGRFFK